MSLRCATVSGAASSVCASSTAVCAKPLLTQVSASHVCMFVCAAYSSTSLDRNAPLRKSVTRVNPGKRPVLYRVVKKQLLVRLVTGRNAVRSTCHTSCVLCSVCKALARWCKLWSSLKW
jgi:hypothetical protein